MGPQSLPLHSVLAPTLRTLHKVPTRAMVVLFLVTSGVTSIRSPGPAHHSFCIVVKDENNIGLLGQLIWHCDNKLIACDTLLICTDNFDPNNNQNLGMSKYEIGMRFEGIQEIDMGT